MNVFIPKITAEAKDFLFPTPPHFLPTPPHFLPTPPHFLPTVSRGNFPPPTSRACPRSEDLESYFIIIIIIVFSAY